MAKNKRAATLKNPLAPKHSSRISKVAPASKVPRLSKPQKQPAQHTSPYIPYTPTSHILLVGEGDFSFARSLLAHHPDRFTQLLATTFESPESLAEKHPQTAAYLAELDEDASCAVSYKVDATKLTSYKFVANHKTEDGAKGWDWIIFNFPHVGGISTDVRRQVRANQELLVKFFEGAKIVLRSPKAKLEQWEERGSEEELDMRRTGGRVLVTLFDGEPYTLWNVRDLARHTGLVVERSFKFQAEGYPGYEHARTLGNVKKKGESRAAACGGELDGANEHNSFGPEEERARETDHEGYVKHARPGAWRGEERPARSYIFKLPSPALPKEKKNRIHKQSAHAQEKDDSENDE